MRRGFPTQAAAKKWRDDQVGRDIDPRDSAQTVGMMAERFLAMRDNDSRLSRHTVAATRSRWNAGLRETFEDMSLAALTRGVIREWQAAQLNKDKSEQSVAQYQTCLSQILEFAIDHKALDRNVAKEVPRTRRTGIQPAPPPDREVINALLDGIEDRYRIILELGVFAGLRGGEALALTIDDVRRLPDGKVQLTIARQTTRGGIEAPLKGRRRAPRHNQSRVVTAEAFLGDCIEAHVEAYGTGPARQIVSYHDGLQITPRRWQIIWEAAKDTAGVKLPRYVGAHMMRHAYASFAHEAGVPIAQIQADLGHSSAATTMGYYVKATERDAKASNAAAAALGRNGRTAGARGHLRAV